MREITIKALVNVRNMVLLTLLTFILSFVSTIPDHRQAFACQCIGHHPETYIERSDVIFRGKVISIERGVGDNIFIPKANDVRLEVHESWKGVDTKSVVVRTGVDRNACGSYVFQAGDEYIVYAFKTPISIETKLCDGSKEIDSVNGREVELRVLNSMPTILLKDGISGTDYILFQSFGIIGITVAISVATAGIMLRRRGKQSQADT